MICYDAQTLSLNVKNAFPIMDRVYPCGQEDGGVL